MNGHYVKRRSAAVVAEWERLGVRRRLPGRTRSSPLCRHSGHAASDSVEVNGLITTIRIDGCPRNGLRINRLSSIDV